METSCQGHVLEFPGLEVILSNILIPVIPDVAVHLGENFRFMDLVINGTSRLIQFSAKAKIFPHPQESHGDNGVTPVGISSNLYILETNRIRRESPYSKIVHCDAADWITTAFQFR